MMYKNSVKLGIFIPESVLIYTNYQGLVMTSHSSNNNFSSLTRYPAGNFAELLAVSIPLILSFLSTNLMLFLDRLILSRYSLDAMNGAALGSIAYFVLFLGIAGVVAIAEVFVGRFNGAAQQEKVGNAVWQMIWFSLFSVAIFWPLAHFAAFFAVGQNELQEHSIPYFQWITFFGPTSALLVAISAFFIGTGKTTLVLFTTILGNVANIVLDVLLVFGVQGFIPELGSQGAAIATGLAQVIQLTVLASVFFAKANRKKYHTLSARFNKTLFFESLKIGVPGSIGHMIEITAWALIMHMMATKGDLYITVSSVGQGLYVLVAFVLEGLNKAITAIVSNHMGAKKWSLVNRSRRCAVLFLVTVSAIVAVPLLLYPEAVVGQFLQADDIGQNYEQLIHNCTLAAFWIWIYFIVDGIAWINIGVLTAAKDTVFVAVVNGLTAWFVALVPVYIAIIHKGMSPVVAWVLTAVYGTVNAIIFTWRCSTHHHKALKNKEAHTDPEK